MNTRTKLLFTAIMLVMTFFAFANLYYLYFSAERADEELNAQNKLAISSYLEGYQSTHLGHIQGFSVSTPLFDDLRQGKNNSFRGQVCGNAYVKENIFASLIVNNFGEVQHYCEYGRLDNNVSAEWLVPPLKGLISDLNSEIGGLFEKYRAITPELRKASSLQKIDQDIYWVSISQVVPQELRNDEESLKYFYLITFVNTERVILKKMADTLPIKNLQMVSKASIPQEQSSFAVSMSEDDSSRIIWDLSNSYVKLYKEFIPIFLLASAIFILAVLFYLWRIAGMQKQIVEREQEAVHASLHDNMTGLPNRKYFNDKLTEVKSTLTPASPYFVGFMDLDKFKAVNDTFGHEVGDAVIIAAGKRIQKVIGENNFCARLGGDEFAFIVVDCTSAKEMDKIASQLNETMKWPLVIEEHEHWPSSSMGICECPRFSNKPEEALKFADFALYKSKKRGRGQYHLFNQADAIEIANSGPDQMLQAV